MDFGNKGLRQVETLSLKGSTALQGSLEECPVNKGPFNKIITLLTLSLVTNFASFNHS